MREILFRAKMKTDNGEYKKGYWVFGDLVRLKDGEKTLTMIYGFGEVDPSTVGQYTGLTDKNGRRIFEGDVVKFDNVLYHIVFETGCFRICKNNQISYTLHNLHSSLEIIGNIYDNPELMEGAG